MKTLILIVKQQVACKITNIRKHSDAFADKRFFNHSKHGWLLKMSQSTLNYKKKDVIEYIRYYNLQKLHCANNDKSPTKYDDFLRKVSY